MVKKKVVVVSKSGLHARPANVLIKNAQQFKSKVEIRIDHQTFNAKSMLGILAAGVNRGEEIEIICTGEDEEDACKAIVKIIKDGLGEERKTAKRK